MRGIVSRGLHYVCPQRALDVLAVDCETTGLDWWSPDFRVFMCQWSDGCGDRGYCTEDTGWDGLHAALARHETLVGANFGFDTHALRSAGIVDLTTTGHRLHDVQTLARVAIPGRFNYRLEALGDDLLGGDSTVQQRALKEAAAKHGVRWTKEDKDYYGLWKLEPDLMARYGLEDVDLTIALWNLVWARANAVDRDVYKMEIAGVSPVLREAEQFGILIDQPRLAALRARLEEERDELKLRLLAQGITEEALGSEATEDEAKVAASSNALLRDLLAAGVPLYRKTPKSGQVNPKTGKRAPDRLAVSKDALNEFVGRFPAVADLMGWRGRNILLRTFVAALEKGRPRVHTSFQQAEARTSRMSTRNPNSQNFPKSEEADENGYYAEGIRDVIVPEPGNAFLVGDYANIEVRMLAHYIADEELTAKIEAGFDLYSLTAASVHGLRYEDCLKGGPNNALRDKAKITALTSMYGGGANLLGIRLGVPTAQAAAIKAETLAAIPGYYALDDRVKRAVQRRAFPHVVTLLGRRLYVPRDKPYVALNTILQGSSAEIMKLGLVAAAAALRPFGYTIVLVVHDEVVAEGPAELREPALAAMLSSMESVYPLRPSLKASGDTSLVSYGRAK